MKNARILIFSFSLLLLNTHKIQAQATNDTSVYRIMGLLIKAEPMSTGCGMFTFAVAQKFRIVESNHPIFKGGYIIIGVKCPELLGRTFFMTGTTYTITVKAKQDADRSSIVNKGVIKKNDHFLWAENVIKPI